MSCNPVVYRAWLDSVLREHMKASGIKQYPACSPYAWQNWHFAEPGAVIIPFHRMRALPKPFTISDEDRNGRTG